MNAMFKFQYLVCLMFSLILLFSCKVKTAESTNYQLVWSDEFNYFGKPDSTKWVYEIGFIRNNEAQYYTNSLKNVSVQNGNLVLEAHQEKIKNTKFKSQDYNHKKWLQYIAETDTAYYTSGSISTQGIVAWTYGKIEVRAKLPQGIGQWPAIWMLGANKIDVGWPACGEIDIMEHVGYDKDSIFGTIHTNAYNHMVGTQKGKSTYIDSPYTKFHVFSIEWTPEYIKFLLDGKVYNYVENEHKTTNEWPFDQDFYLKLNLAVGGGLGGKYGIDNSVFPQKMEIDYVRVYQKK
jgi:beta-glucanase (GH16 family)